MIVARVGKRLRGQTQTPVGCGEGRFLAFGGLGEIGAEVQLGAAPLAGDGE